MKYKQQQVEPSEDDAKLAEKIPESFLQIARYSGNAYTIMPETEKDELARTKEEINKARESLMQEWLDSKPIIDQLEKLQVDLKHTKSRASMATVVTTGLKAQLETTYATIKLKEEKQLEASATADKLSKSLEQIRENMVKLELETDRERRARGKLKLELRLRRQTLRTLKLTLRAIRIESEALEASTADALHHINQSNITDETNVQLSHEEYCALIRKAHEEMELADWRVSVSMEQRDAAEASRDETLRKLKHIYAGNRPREGDIEVEDNMTDLGEQDISDEAEDPRTEGQVPENIRTSLGATMVPANARRPSQKFRKYRKHHNEKRVKKKKRSILHKLKSFLVQKITKLFG